MSRGHTRTGTGRRPTWIALFALAVVAGTVAGATGAVAAAGSSQDGDATVTLTVTVTDESGTPISDALLSATWDGGGPVNRTTAGNGKAFLDVPAGEEVRITVDHPHFIRNHPYVVENASEREVSVVVAQKGRATVVVRNATGRVDDAVVRLAHDERRLIATRTNAEGEFTTGEIERGEYELLAYKEGYLRNVTTFTVDGEVSQGITIERATRLVTFTVTDDHFDPPRAVNNASISIRSIVDVRTQGTGSVSVSVPVNDEYEVDITKEGYESVTRTLTVEESRTSLNATIRRTPRLDAETVNQQIVVNGTAQVSLTDEYGDPVANATVTLDGSEVGRTDADGDIRVPIRDVGNHTIAASNGGLQTSVVVEGVLPAPEETPTPTPTPTGTPTDEQGSSGFAPGFGLVVTVVALLAAGAFVARRGE